MKLFLKKLHQGKRLSILIVNLIRSFYCRVGISMLWGNLYYVYMARKLAFKEQRSDVCTMPYGMNTPGAFAFIYVIILPTYYGCIASNEKSYCQELSWHVALASNLMTGIILLLLSVFGEFIRRNTPSVALLSSISGLGFVFLALNEYLPVAATPIVSFVPFAIVMLGFFGQGENHDDYH